MTTHTSRLRRGILTATATVTVLAGVLASPAASSAPAPPGPPAPVTIVHAGSPTSAVNRVAQFYGAYIDALHDSRRGPLANALRTAYLTKDLRDDLKKWENDNKADGVLRAQNVPAAWAVKYHDTSGNQVFSYVRLSWGTPTQRTYTYLVVRSDLRTKLISGIRSITRPTTAASTTRPQDRPQDRPVQQQRPATQSSPSGV